MHVVEQLRRTRRKRVVGLMSGTSADGIGATLATIEGVGLETRARTEALRVYPYAPPVREGLLRLTTAAGSARDVCLMNYVIGELYARAALSLIAEAGRRPEDVDLIGMDGHTIQRVIPAATVGGIATQATLQVGEPAVVAERTGVTTVADFRRRDVAAGGEGAPISSYVDFLLFRDPKRTRVVLNIGGISAMTVVPAGAGIDDVFAVTAGPGNMVIDGVVRRLTNGARSYDGDGEWARRGVVHRKLLDELEAHPFFSRPPPKSGGTDLFGADYVDAILRRRDELGVSDDDLVATVTALTAETIAGHLKAFVEPRTRVDDVVAGGGGVHNPTLLAMLRSLAVNVRPLDAFGVDVDGKEPLMFAVLANEALHGRRCNLPAATGAAHQVVLGSVTPGGTRTRTATGKAAGTRARRRAGPPAVKRRKPHPREAQGW